jgi:hypothetical protein
LAWICDLAFHFNDQIFEKFDDSAATAAVAASGNLRRDFRVSIKVNIGSQTLQAYFICLRAENKSYLLLFFLFSLSLSLSLSRNDKFITGLRMNGDSFMAVINGIARVIYLMPGEFCCSPTAEIITTR